MEELRRGLIVSCQADDGDPLDAPAILAALAASAVQGGAVAIRACGVENIRAIKAAVPVPVIGLTKRHVAGSPIYITPTWDDVVACREAGADIVAMDATNRRRPDGYSLEDIVRHARALTGLLLMADVSRAEEGEQAAALGFDLVSTTLSGYTEASPAGPEPDFAVISELAARLSTPIVAEGRITTPAQAMEALRRGAWSVCVGKAITAPHFITNLFVQSLRDAQPDKGSEALWTRR